MQLRSFSSAILFLTSILVASSALSQWKYVSGPHGMGASKLFRMRDNRIYASTNGGIFRSDDDGMTWTPAGSHIYPGTIAEDPTGTLYATSPFYIAWSQRYGSNVFRSTDHGDSWTELPYNHSEANSMCCDSLGNIFVGNNARITCSTDGGESWRSFPANFEQVTYLRADAFDTSIYASDSYTLKNSKWRDDTLRKFQNNIYTDQETIERLEILPNGHRLAIDYHIWRSVDDGKTWKKITSDSSVSAYRFFAMPNGELFASSQWGHLIHSTDEGEHWTPIWTDRPYPPYNSLDNWNCVVPDRNGNYIVGAYNFMYRSTDGGKTYSVSTKGKADIPISELYASKNTIVAAALHRGIWISTDNGLSWDTVLAPLSSRNWSGFTKLHNGQLLAASGTVSDEGLSPAIRSTDEGRSWQWFETDTILYAKNIIERKDGKLFARIPNMYATSSDTGKTWTKVEGGISLVQGSHPVYCLDSSNTVFISCGSVSMAKYVDSLNLLVWTKNKFPFLPNWYPQAMSATRTGTLLLACDTGLFRSTDKGDTWIFMNKELPAKRTNAMCISPSGAIFVGTGDTNKLYRSTDDGLTWKVLDGGLPKACSITALAVSPDGNLYAGTDHCGIYYLSAANDIPTSHKNSGHFDIELCPNPAAVSTNVSFLLTDSSPIHIDIYDALGRSVYSKIHTDTRIGYNTITISLTDIPFGMYFVRLSSNNETIAKQLVHIP